MGRLRNSVSQALYRFDRRGQAICLVRGPRYTLRPNWKDGSMPRVCEFTGRKSKVGHSLRYRGKAKYLGGVGRKLTGKSKRTFHANLHTVTAMIDGVPRRVKASAKALKSGMVIK